MDELTLLTTFGEKCHDASPTFISGIYLMCQTISDYYYFQDTIHMY